MILPFIELLGQHVARLCSPDKAKEGATRLNAGLRYWGKEQQRRRSIRPRPREDRYCQSQKVIRLRDKIWVMMDKMEAMMEQLRTIGWGPVPGHQQLRSPILFVKSLGQDGSPKRNIAKGNYFPLLFSYTRLRKRSYKCRWPPRTR